MVTPSKTVGASAPKKIKKNHITLIQNRDGVVVKYDISRVEEAIFKALSTTEEGGKKDSKELAKKVAFILNRRFKKGEIPHVEKIQDIVEEVLILQGYAETAKNYILYREQRRRVRENKITKEESIDLMGSYLDIIDWEIKENSNMEYSLQGLNNYIANNITKKYWLNKIYPKEIREAAKENLFHIHDLGTLGAYCCGWDLQDLLLKGFGGVAGKIQSAPAKHFRTALGHMINFFYTLQGEVAGAQAFSNFDTLLAPFVRYDNLSYKEVKQALQEFLCNVNVPTRVGFQCLSQDTEILTPEGWRGYEDIKKGDVIKTFNLKNQRMEEKKVSLVFKKEYSGEMYNLKNRIQDQLISPNHRVVRKLFSVKPEKYVLEPIEDVLKLKSPIVIPIAAKNSAKDIKMSDEQIKLLAWIISEGSVERPGAHRCCYRVSIYQSKVKNSAKYEEIIKLLKHFKLEYSEYGVSALGSEVTRMRMNAESSRIIHEWFGTKENVHFIPESLWNMSERQSRMFLETYLKADGWEGCKIGTAEPEILNGLQIICANAGWGFTVLTRKPTIGTKDIFVLRIIKHPETYIVSIKKVNYSGIIWSVHTDNETVIARRNGKVFITGNTPFTNITLDLKVPEHHKDMPIIIGGEMKKETYGEFKSEMDLINRALCDVFSEGDSTGRVFTFPIPTYNITKDFDWDNPSYEGIWKMTAKYGIPSFSNFINSELSPADATSMCCRLKLDNRELYKRGGGLFGASPKTGSLGVVTINLPHIAYLSKTRKEFFDKLKEAMDLAKNSLEIKRKTIEQYTIRGLYPYCRYYLQDVKKMRGSYWANHFSTIGLVGGHEMCLNFLGCSIADIDGKNFMGEVLDFMRQRMIKYQEETGSLYNLEATPAEGTSYRLAQIDKKMFPEIITSGTPETPYYTNSSQLPVGFSEDLFEVLDHQDNLQTKYSGGTILHGFIGEEISDPMSVKSLIKTIFSSYRLPYMTITPTFSICPTHGYIAGEHFLCPKCVIEQKCEVYSRVVGYLRPVQSWHEGKQQEFKERLEFKWGKATDKVSLIQAFNKVKVNPKTIN